MSNDTFSIKINVSDNPWISSYKTIEFSRSKIQIMVDEIIANCSDKENYTSSYQYDSHVRSVMNSVPSDLGSRRPLYYALRKLIIEQTPKGEFELSWNNPYVAAERSLMSFIAYSTPGFIEAKRYSELYGS